MSRSKNGATSWCAAISALVTLLVGGCYPPLENEEAEVAEWHLSPEIRIAGHEHSLVPIHGIAVSREGVIAISQPQDRLVRLFDRSGRLAAVFGRGGSGPGEFQAPGGLGWIGDTLWVHDALLRRYNLSDPQGIPIGTVAVSRRPDPLTGLGFFPLTLHADSSITVRRGLLGIGMNFGVGGMPLPPDATQGNSFFRLYPDGTERELARTPPSPSYFARRLPDGRSMYGWYPFPDVAHAELSDDGRWLGFVHADLDDSPTATFRAVLLDSSGDTVFDRRHSIGVTRIPRAAIDDALEAHIRLWRMRGSEMVAEFRRGLHIPPVYPPISGIVVGHDGFLWLRLRDEDEDEERSYLVLDRQGDLSGRVVVPRNVEIRRADRSHAWAIERDDWDVQSVIRYRIYGPDEET